MPATRATLHHKPVRTAWCDICQLSTRRTVHVWAINRNGITDLGEVTWCTRCTKSGL